MLVLSRRVGEEIVIAENVRVRIVAVNGGKVRMGVSAPETIRVDRAEVHGRRSQFAAGSTPPAMPTNGMNRMACAP